MPFRTLLANTTPKGKAVLAASAVGVRTQVPCAACWLIEKK